MGLEAAIRINGPWLVDANFPGHFSSPITPSSFEEITHTVQILTPPTPVYGVIMGGVGMPIGLHVEGAYPFRRIKLPVFEWCGYEQNVRSPFPLKNQHYFALSEKFEGESSSTARVTIGKIALLDDSVSCAIPVKETWQSKPTVVEVSTSKRPDVRESVAQAIFSVINGELQPDFSYSKSNFDYALRLISQRKSLMQKVKQARKPVSRIQKLLNKI